MKSPYPFFQYDKEFSHMLQTSRKHGAGRFFFPRR
jgi:hypothetical protein